MVRSLWTAASGMKAQQTSVDTIANNLANVNTTGYKSQTTQFKTLLYQTMQEASTTANGDTKPTTAQVGLGARVASINSIYTQGAELASDNKMAMYINGRGFFSVTGEDGGTYYTRNGDFDWALDDNGTRVLTNSEGNKVGESNYSASHSCYRLCICWNRRTGCLQETGWHLCADWPVHRTLPVREPSWLREAWR